MSKKRRQQPTQPKDGQKNGPAPGPGASSQAGEGGKSLFKVRAAWFLAFLLAIAGFAALKKADPWGRNGWSTLSPALILSGYLLFIPAILLSSRRS